MIYYLLMIFYNCLNNNNLIIILIIIITTIIIIIITTIIIIIIIIGEKLNSVTMKSEALTQHSKRYEQTARNMRMTAIWKKRMMYLSVLFVVLFFLFLRLYWFA